MVPPRYCLVSAGTVGLDVSQAGHQLLGLSHHESSVSGHIHGCRDAAIQYHHAGTGMLGMTIYRKERSPPSHSPGEKLSIWHITSKLF